VTIATDGCHDLGRNDFLAQKLEAIIISLVSVHCHVHRFSHLLPCRRFVQYETRNCERTSMQLWKCFTVSPFRSACLTMLQTTMMTIHRQLQCACKQGGCREMQQRELGVRFSLFGPHWIKPRSKNKNDATCVVPLRLTKTKFQHGASFCQHWHLTWQNWAKFFTRDVLTLHR